MCENDATVLVALPPSDRRETIVALLRENGFTVTSADDGIEAVDAVRDVDAVLVGGYPDRVTAAVVNATTPPGVSRPNVLVDSDTESGEDERPTGEDERPTGENERSTGENERSTGGGTDTAASSTAQRNLGSIEPDSRLPATATDEAIVDAVARAVARGAYRKRVSEFSAVAAEAANTDRGSQRLTSRVTALAEEARGFQDAFSPSDWTATFRTLAGSSGRRATTRLPSRVTVSDDRPFTRSR